MKSKTVNLLKVICTAMLLLSLCMGLAGARTKTEKSYAEATFDTNLITISKGASIRIDEPTGIRFNAVIDNSLLNTEANPVTFKNKTGMIIAPEQAFKGLWNGTNWTADVFNHITTTYSKTKADISVEFASNNVKFENEKYSVNGAIVNIFENHYNWKYMAVAYYENGETILYSAPSDVRSIVEVADLALKDTGATYTEAQKATLQAIVDKGDPVIDPLTFIETGSPYTYNEAEGCYERKKAIGYDATALFTVKKDYIDSLKAQGITSLTIRVTGTTGSRIAKSDKGATDLVKRDDSTQECWLTFNLLHLEELPLGINTGVTATGDMTSNGAIVLKIYPGTESDLKVWLDYFKPDNAKSFVATGSEFTFDQATKCYERDYKSAEKWYGTTLFTVKSEYIEYLKAQGVTTLTFRVEGAPNVTVAKSDAGATDMIKNKASGALVFDLTDLTKVPEGIDPERVAGITNVNDIIKDNSIVLKVYAGEDSHVKVFLDYTIPEQVG